ncbi:MAG: hypothetical protein HC936_08765 [Leptolyngbyaceae cyanobacterium SU_3_3]|nr:hypothetical protein [Leptolyngbyaceae cyanobacterium SU_3_3]
MRHTKVATIWSAQILLYPVYALFQSTRMIGRQISQTIQRSFHQLTQATDDDRPSPSLTIDTPIQQVLAALQGTEAAQSNDRPPRSFLQRLLARLLFLLLPPLSHGACPRQPLWSLLPSPFLSAASPPSSRRANLSWWQATTRLWIF